MQMTIFAMFVFVAFGVIIVTEKASVILIPKVENKMNEYIEENYKEIQNDITKSEVTYKATVYQMKVSNKNNNHLYFYINKKNKKITDTYKKDYLEGKSILSYTSNKIEKDINKKTKTNYKVSIELNLNDFSKEIQDSIIKEDNLLNLRIYNIEKEYKVNKINQDNIKKIITEEINNLENNNITPRTYSFIFTNKNDITNQLKISNITYKILENESFNEIINDIINDNNSKLVKNAKIKFEYLN